jgi:hypothetical protein
MAKFKDSYLVRLLVSYILLAVVIIGLFGGILYTRANQMMVKEMSHPQVTFERDLTLAGIGAETLEERGYWLAQTSASQDEWLVERRAALLVNQGKFEEAKQLLQHTVFQLVYQRGAYREYQED